MRVTRQLLHLPQSLVQKALRRIIQLLVQSRDHTQPAFTQLAVLQNQIQIPLHDVQRIPSLILKRRLSPQDHLLITRPQLLLLGDRLHINQSLQNIIPLLDRSIEIPKWREPRRTPDQPRNQCRLTQCQLGRMLAKIHLARPLNPPQSRPEKDPVDVVLQNLILANRLLNPARQHHLQQLPVKAPVIQIRITVTCQLHRQSARSLHNPAIPQIANHRP